MPQFLLGKFVYHCQLMRLHKLKVKRIKLLPRNLSDALRTNWLLWMENHFVDATIVTWQLVSNPA